MHDRSNVKPSAKKIFARQPPSLERALPGRKKMQKPWKYGESCGRIAHCNFISPERGKGARTMDELFQRMQARAYANAFAVYNHI